VAAWRVPKNTITTATTTTRAHQAILLARIKGKTNQSRFCLRALLLLTVEENA
jgi:predicted DsbA family dithiol-disulfide isomerase